MNYLKFTPCLFLLGAACHAQNRNVVLIMTDDQGYGEFSINGNPLIQTPNIDRLAQEGVRLTNFHASSMSTPTRGQLMTGLDAFRNGAMNVSSGRTMMRPEVPTIAETFGAAGYSTSMFGKWHLGYNYPYRPVDRGFDEAIWYPSSHVSSVPDTWNNDYFDDTYIHNTQREAYEGYCTDLFFGEAMKWIKGCKEAGKPFFTYIPLNASHWPHFVPERFRDIVRKNMDDNPGFMAELRNKNTNIETLTSFLAMGLCIDENVGKFMSFLEDEGLDENTVVVFLTDNGTTMSSYYNAGMRGQKISLFEGGHRVPCFIKAPGLLGDREIDELCQVQDLFPTLCAMAGVSGVPTDLDGVDLYPLLKGEVDKLEDRILVVNYSRMPYSKVTYTDQNPAIPHKDGSAVMWGYWRLLENRYLYNVKEDPHQDHNVADKYPEIAAKLSAHLDAWWADVKDLAFEIQRSFIGTKHQNPVMLTTCEWLNVIVDQQKEVRNGVRKNGVWYVTVAKSGKYEFELSRWAKESGLALSQGIPATKVTDGMYLPGKELPIRYARIKVGDKVLEKEVSEEDTNAVFELRLKEGDTEIQTWFLDENKEPICGAYYMYVLCKSRL